ncbi:hypothetical protein LIP_0985 [Limnochorda pilosa]|uniref:Uncharacterized protein n=1 Tax=Limnochorda pilosa TaxID=1555112 RepID=A0A0K2SIJ2_LIMPI|nr:hypothetical protein LIP_0985 [Limnochorda pilosa]
MQRFILRLALAVSARNLGRIRNEPLPIPLNNRRELVGHATSPPSTISTLALALLFYRTALHRGESHVATTVSQKKLNEPSHICQLRPSSALAAQRRHRPTVRRCTPAIPESAAAAC